ncbi:MAG: ABC transporter permease [Planctomycetes bacterium]|nr:ABC transporter permease [Planctomycetota bacterium]
MYRLFLAVRYLLTRPINLLGMAGILVSVWALVVVVSIFSGFLQQIELHVRSASADISVHELPAWAEWTPLERALRDDPNVADTARRLVHYGMLSRPGQRPASPPLLGRSALHGGDQPFLFVLGIDAAAEARVTGFGSWLENPEIPAELRVADRTRPLAADAGRPRVLVGLERLQREGLHRGDTVVLTSGRLQSEPDGQKGLQQVTLELVVAGAFKTHHGGFDGNNVFVDHEVLRAALFPDAPDGVQEIAVRCRDAATLDATATRLQRAVARVLDRGDDRAYGKVQTWREKNGQFLASVEHQRGLLKIVLIVIMVTAAFLMLATLSMMVTEKTSDIGILTAMGATPLGVLQVFLACGLTITAAGVVLGLLLGTVTSVFLEEIRQFVLWATSIDLFPLKVYNLDRVPCAIDPLWLLQVAAMALAVGTVVSAWPAWRAARHDPLVSLRGN